MKPNPWVSPFLPGSAPDRYAHLERRAVYSGLKAISLEARAEELKAQMREIFLCGDQVSRLIDRLLAIGESHARANFSSPQEIVRAIYNKTPWDNTAHPAIMLTGLAGTGKTELVRAIQRFLEARIQRVDLPGHQNIDIRSAWFMSLKSGSTLNALVGPFIAPRQKCDPYELTPAPRKDLKQSLLLELAGRVSRRDGICTAFVDELQFITRSAQANSQAMGLLLQLLSLGPRLIFVANYSLIHRLTSRRQEDRHRVLANHIELAPDDRDSGDFLEYVRELTKLSPKDFRFDAGEAVDSIHQYSHGIKRAVVELLGNAWIHCKTRRGERADVTESDLRSAYLSSGYTPYREDVAALGRCSRGDKGVRSDLVNPLFVEIPEEKVVVAQAAVTAFNRRVNEKYLEDSLTPKEREARSKLFDAAKDPADSAKVQRLRPQRARDIDPLRAFEELGKSV